MKKNLVKIILVVAVSMPVSLWGQSHYIDKIYEKYAGTEGFTSINISAEMFKLAASLGAANGPASKEELGDILNQLQGLKILVYDDARKSIDAEALKKEIRQSIQSKDFTELMSISEPGSNVKFLTKAGPGNKISELVMVAEDGKEIVVMSFSGLIDLETIGKISRSMNMQGMEKLEKLNQNE